MLVVRKELIDKHPEIVTAVTKSIIEACRFIVTHRERTIDIYMKASGETDRKLVGEGYDALHRDPRLRRQWRHDAQGSRRRHQAAVENGAKSIPIESWSDFRFQEEALKQIGKVAGMSASNADTVAQRIVDATAACGISLVASLPDGWITSLISHYDQDARFRHVAVNREESAIGLCSGAFFSGLGTFALMGASGFLTCIYAITKINYTYQIPMLIGITLRGRPGDKAKFHQSNGLYLDDVIQRDQHPVRADRDAATIFRASPPPISHSRVMSRPVVVGFTREMLRGEA